MYFKSSGFKLFTNVFLRKRKISEIPLYKKHLQLAYHLTNSRLVPYKSRRERELKTQTFSTPLMTFFFLFQIHYYWMFCFQIYLENTDVIQMLKEIQYNAIFEVQDQREFGVFSIYISCNLTSPCFLSYCLEMSMFVAATWRDKVLCDFE
ncbi:hypothetical protein K501DRAFT_276356 [Backusella circina FSU 941]|nr:hypothetical protein K501DRAFT_276356 [Backusella circina FSU 941]